MAKLRRDTTASSSGASPPIGSGSPVIPGAFNIPEFNRSLRIVSSGTLFLTHTLYVPVHPAPSTAIRAHAVEKSRGGSANTILSVLAQFPAVEAILVAPLAGNEEGMRILRDLEVEGVNTQYCKIWPNAGVPSAWVLHSIEYLSSPSPVRPDERWNAAQENTRTVINHNPLPDITHEDFVSLLGPRLAPENYPENYLQLQQQQLPHHARAHSPLRPDVSPRPGTAASGTGSTIRSSQSGVRPPLTNPSSPAPFDWLHFEGRSVKTTLNNMVGLDGLAREKKWRSHCVFSVDIGRKARQGVEALIPHADVLFLNKQYARVHSPDYANSPRTFLLSFASVAPSHALLVAHWGKDGAAVLSLPTREYFQSSSWVGEPSPQMTRSPDNRNGRPTSEVRSVRSGSEFWADGRSQSSSSNMFSFTHQSGENSMDIDHSLISHQHTHSDSRAFMSERDNDDDERGSQDTERGRDDSTDIIDEVGAHDAFIAGMVYALSRRICPGAPYTPSAGGRDDTDGTRKPNDDVRAKWRLDECLRFATELAGRKARRKTWDGLADEMIRAGWFEF